MRQREHQSGFGSIEVLLVVLAVAVLAVSGLIVYKRHVQSRIKNSATTSSTQTTIRSPSTPTTQTYQSATQYVTIKEWGVKMPLSNSIKEAYYVVPTGISLDEDKLPSGVILGITLNSSCGMVTPSVSDYANSFGEIVRVLPTDKDPVSNKLYTLLYPDGTTISGYYYGYSSTIKGKTCAPQATLQSVDSALATSAKGIVAVTN